MAAPPLAVARAVNVWNPVYTHFAIAGPGQYLVRIVRGSSVNAELCGIFIDRADVPRTIFDNKAMTCLWGVDYCAPKIPKTPGGAIPRDHFITSTWQHTKHAFGRSGFAARATARLLAYRDTGRNCIWQAAGQTPAEEPEVENIHAQARRAVQIRRSY